MIPLLQRIRVGDTIISDGALGTMLFQMGLQSGECPEALNLTSPELPERVAALYLEAGAEIITTNTFGGSPVKLAMYGLQSKVVELNTAGVAAVRRAVGRRAHVAGSCGPNGRMLKPMGNLSPEEALESFRTQIRTLVDAGIDVVFIETMIDLNEAVLAVRAAKEVAPTLPVSATMTFNRTPRGFFTIMGASVRKAAEVLEAAGADLIGSNCGNGIENMVALAHELRLATSRPLIIQSNAGLPEMRNGAPVYSETPEFMAEKARALLEVGVAVIGGCCGTTPEHIRILRQTLKPSGQQGTGGND